MGYIARHASGCHYESTFADVVSFLEMNPMEFEFYEADKDYSNDFFYVLANPKSIKPWTNQFDWNFIRKKVEAGANDKKRQEKNVGYGYTAGHCNTHDKTMNDVGVSEPRLREKTGLPEVRRHFDLLTNFSVRSG